MSTPFGEYHLIERIAAGGMAEIWRAEIHGLGGFKRDVAIKRILPEHTHDEKFVEMLLDEARIAARLSHPNIAQVIQCGIIDGSYYIVMELVDGVPLSRVLSMLGKAGERMPQDCALHVGVGLLRALDCAHKATSDTGKPLEVVHRDVSPHNLLVSAHGDAKLIDFGVAQAADRLHKTETGVLKGKITYMAPEQVQAGLVDARTDQYAAALVVAEMLTGKRVHGGHSEIDVLRAVIDADPASIRAQLEHESIPPAVCDALVKALARRADDRFADCGALATALIGAVPIDVEGARLKLAAYVPRVRAMPRVPQLDADTEAPTKKLTPSGGTRDPAGDTVPLAHTALVDRPPTEAALVVKGSSLGSARALGAVAALALAALGFAVLRPDAAGTVVDAGTAGAVVDAGAVAMGAVDAGAPTVAVAVGGGTVGAVDGGTAALAGAVDAGAVGARTVVDAGVRTARKRATGTLDLACLPWCEIAIDGKGGLRSPLRAHVLDAGEHTVDVVNPPTGKRAQVKVRIEAGRATKESVRLE